MAPTQRSWRWLLAGAIVLLGLLAPAVAAAETTALSPALTVNPGTVSAGDKVTVKGSGWPGSQLVDLSICGNGGDGGSANCNRSGAATIGVGDDGEFGATLMAVIPPVACPCVVRGTSGQWSAVQPIDVIGAPLRTAPSAIAVPVVDAVVVDGSGPPAAWFGASPLRDVKVSVSNPSTGVVRDARVEVRWGDAGSEQSRILEVPDPIAAGARAVVTTTIDLGALTWGDVPVRARVVTTGEPTWVSASTSSYPWGLLVVAFVLLQVVVIAIVRRNRRRRRAREAELATVDGPLPDTAPAAAASGIEPAPAPVVDADLAEGPDVPAVPARPTDDFARGAAPAPSAARVPVSPVVGPGFGGAPAAVDTIERPDGTTATPDEELQQPMTGPVTAAPWTRPRR